MKTLRKRIFRTIGKNKSFYISSFLLTAMAIMVFIAEICAGKTVGNNYADFMKDSKVEDAQFTVMKEPSDDEISSLESEYKLSIEKQYYYDAEEEGFVLRIFEPTEKINLYKVTEGNDISHEGQILLSDNFAEANNISVGGSIELHGKSYEVCGFMERPDYLYMIRNSGDIFHSNDTFGAAVMQASDLEGLGAVTGFYSVRYDDDDKIRAFREKLYDEYTTLSYTAAENNIRISQPGEIAKSCYSSGYSMVAMMCILVMFIISLILGRIVQKESKQIGTLSAFGYRKREIKMHYMLYGIIPALGGSILGLILSVISLKPLVKYSTSQLEYIDFGTQWDMTAIVLSFIIPLVLYGFTAYRTAGKLLAKNEVAELLTNRFDENKKHHAGVFSKTDKKISTKFKLRTLISNKKRTVIAFIGLFFGCVCILFGFAMKDSIYNFFDTAFDEMGKYNYQYYLSEPRFSDTEPVTEGEAMNAVSYELEESGDMINLFGIEADTKLIDTSVEDGSSFDQGKYYLTSIAASVFKLKEGDSITLSNPMSLEKQDIEIAGIISNNVTVGIYTGRENLCRMSGIENESYYNMISSSKRLTDENDIPVYTIISKDSLKQQMDDVITTLSTIIYLVMFLGVFICIIFVYICINQIINENLLNVSMFKVLGYRDKEINSMVLTPYHIFVPIVFLLSIPASKAMAQGMWDMYAGMYNFQASAILSAVSIIIALVLFVGSYIASLFILRKKVFKADMVEVLKDNRE